MTATRSGSPVNRVPGLNDRARLLAPGIALSAAVAALAWLLAQLEESLLTYAVIEAVVLALLIGMVIRTFWVPTERFVPGIGFTAKPLLEFGIVLLGASLDLQTLQDAGGRLLITILLTTSAALGIGILLGRRAGRRSVLQSASNHSDRLHVLGRLALPHDYGVDRVDGQNGLIAERIVSRGRALVAQRLETAEQFNRIRKLIGVEHGGAARNRFQKLGRSRLLLSRHGVASAEGWEGCGRSETGNVAAQRDRMLGGHGRACVVSGIGLGDFAAVVRIGLSGDGTAVIGPM